MIYDITKETQTRLDNTFTYHQVHGNQAERYVQLRDKAKELAYLIVQLSPVSREQSVALTKLQECIMFANAGIAINESAVTLTEN